MRFGIMAVANENVWGLHKSLAAALKFLPLATYQNCREKLFPGIPQRGRRGQDSLLTEARHGHDELLGRVLRSCSEPPECAAAGLSSLAAVAAADPSPRRKPWVDDSDNHGSPGRGERRVDSASTDRRARPVVGVGQPSMDNTFDEGHGSIAPAGAFMPFRLLTHGLRRGLGSGRPCRGCKLAATAAWQGRQEIS